MVYFGTDDYGISKGGNRRIEECLTNGVLNKISVLPNGDISGFREHLNVDGVKLALHINLVEGRPLSDPKEIDLLVDDDGCFKYSFNGLLRMSLSSKRKEMERQIYKELNAQLTFWREEMGEDTPLMIDSHQHTYMIPLIFKVLMRVIKNEGFNVKSMRIPAEPLSPYILTPSLYLEYSPVNLAKQWLLKFFGMINRREFERSGIQTTYFMGALFSGRLTEKRIKKLLPKYMKLADKHDKNIEVAFHPGYFEPDEKAMDGIREDFKKFYFSPGRKTEYDTLINFKF